MASYDPGRPLPKFGEWDVSNPVSAEGFTVIFTKARDQKMIHGPPGSGATTSSKLINMLKKWPCCCCS